MNSVKTAVYQGMASWDSSPHRPPGMSNLTKLIGWCSWGVGLAALLGFIGGLAYMISCAFRGQEIEGVKPSLICLVVSIIAGSAGLFFNELT